MLGFKCTLRINKELAFIFRRQSLTQNFQDLLSFLHTSNPAQCRHCPESEVILAAIAIMSILEILPSEIFRMILQFLSPHRELVLLDTAMVNHRLRSFYLATIEGMTINDGVRISSEKSWYQEDFRAMNWLLNRKILPTQISLSHCNPFSFPLLVDRSRIVLQHLRIHQTPQMDDSLFLSLGHFPSLTSLNISSIYEDQISSFIHFLSLNPQLEELILPDLTSGRDVDHSSRELVRGISQTCINLTSLTALAPWFEDDHVALLSQGRLSKLEELDIYDEAIVQEHDSIVNILNAFPLLKTFDINTAAYQLSPTTKVYYLNEYALPRLRSGEPELQRLGLELFDEILEVRSWFVLSVLTSSS
jgi:hypothetical protein